MINPMELTGKHILITGGSSGIGRACAIQASRLGARVTIIARREEALKETISMMDNPSEHAYFVADLSDIEAIDSLVKSIVAERGAVDGFCHSVGIADVRILRTSKPDFVEKMFRINTFSFYELVRCLSLKKNCSDGASLVGISSSAAINGAVAQGIYSGTKAALNGFLHPVAKELGKRRIRMNNVAYALVDTPMKDDFLEYSDESKLAGQHLGIIEPESAANAVMFLLSDASKFITASVLSVYAGF